MTILHYMWLPFSGSLIKQTMFKYLNSLRSSEMFKRENHLNVDKLEYFQIVKTHLHGNPGKH